MENTFLSSMRVDQFIKLNNDQLKDTLNSTIGGMGKNISTIVGILNSKSINSGDSSESKSISKAVSILTNMQKRGQSGQSNKDVGDVVSKSISKVMSRYKSTDKVTPKTGVAPKEYFKKDGPMKITENLLSKINKGVGGLAGALGGKAVGGFLGFLGGLLGGIGKFMAIGGLLGFVLTGKSEFLNTTIKGIRYMAKSFLFMLKIPKMVTTAMSVLPKMMNGVVTGMSKSLAKLNPWSKSTPMSTPTPHSKSVVGSKVVSKNGAGKMVSNTVGKTAGTAVGKTVGKSVGKTAGKMTLKRIPVLGSAMALAFAFDRFRKGDVAGGFMELGSGALGLADIIAPGLGTALSLAADLAIAGRDVKRAMNPSIGDGIGDAYTMKSGKIKPAKLRNTSKLNTPINFAKNKVKTPESKLIKILDALANTSSVVDSSWNHIKGGMLKDKFKLRGGADISGMNSQVWHNFLNMANDYARLTGTPLGINSAYRSIDDQTKLYEAGKIKYGANVNKYVAPPGRSMHNYGFALDINSNDADLLANKGILSKWGFDRPMGHEAWHIEPKGLASQYASIRSGSGAKLTEERGSPIGDAYPIKVNTSAIPKDIANLPEGNLSKFNSVVNNTPTVVTLTDADIQKLAIALGKHVGANIPIQTPKSPSGSGGSGRKL